MSKSYTLTAYTDHSTPLRWVRAEWYDLTLGKFINLEDADTVVFDVRKDGDEWDSVSATQVGTSSNWNADHTFTEPGRYTVIPKATVDGDVGYGRPITVIVEDL